MVRRLLVVVCLALLAPGSSALAAPQSAQPAVGAGASGTTVLFVGGYASTNDTAARAFQPLRAALQARDPALAFALYSYAGWNAPTCSPLNYQADATGQDFELSKQLLLQTINALHTQCGAQRIVVIGHSLGGLVAFHALADNPMGEVTDVVTIDSPLGGAPSAEVQACIDAGLCVPGPVSGVLAELNGAWVQTALDNAARVSQLAASGIRVTAWGNESDCLYDPSVCMPFASYLVGSYDVRDTQWLGVQRAMRRDYAPGSTLAGLLSSHQVILTKAAPDIAADVTA
jgi:pimeloyl-ACP methyl ester carboxylesterase